MRVIASSIRSSASNFEIPYLSRHLALRISVIWRYGIFGLSLIHIWTVAQPADAKLRGKWWEIFDDPELNALEEQLNINNQNIKEYYENYMEARAIVREARSQYFPTLTAVPAITHSRTSANLGTTAVNTGTGTTATVPKLQSSLYSLPLEASWEPDLWGKVRNTVREAQYAAQVSAADLENERLAEQASLAEYFFEIRCV